MMAARAVATMVLGTFVICHQVSSILAGCGSLFFPDQHHALIGHSFLAETGTGRIQCMMLCWRHSRCLSFNHDDTSGTCQLNHARKEEFPESYRQDDRFSYFGSSNKRHDGFFETTTSADKTAVATTTQAAATTTPAVATTITAAATTTPAVATTTQAAATTTPAVATTITTAATTTPAAATTTTSAATTTPAVATTITAAATTTPAAATTTTNACSMAPFGMESGAIADSQITSTDALNHNYTSYGPKLARFNGGSSWCGIKKSAAWIQVDMGSTKDLYAIIVQGRNGGNQFVAHFYLSYSDDGVTWTNIVNEDGSNKYHFSSQSSTEDVHVSVESAPSVGMIRCRYIRIRPSGWVYDKCMRFELIGCD